uniref:G domain-containing protein n=1 Tax=Rhabditophanes sp. KR3021 TaxID=114890 RepID=A0AC35U3I3_9BILA
MTGIFQWKDSEMTAQPTVMIVGHAGIGKTTLLNYFFKEAYAGSSMSVMTPTTDFNIIVQGGKNEVIFINKSIIADNLNYFHLERVTSETLDKIKLVHSTNPLANYIILVVEDTYEQSELVNWVKRMKIAADKMRIIVNPFGKVDSIGDMNRIKAILRKRL